MYRKRHCEEEWQVDQHIGTLIINDKTKQNKIKKNQATNIYILIDE